MGLDIAFRSRPLQQDQQATAADVARIGATGAAIGTVFSGAFHHFGPPKMALGGPWAKATFGVGLMAGLGAATLAATNRTGDRTNSMLGSAALTTAAFAVPGIWIHGKMDFSGNPVNRWAAAAGVALTGAVFSPFFHEATMPRD